jgi:hypothetical protein
MNLVRAPGTNPMTLSLSSGTLPPGLTFNASTGVISGTPTAGGVYNVTVQLVDSSAVPYTVTLPVKIVISTPAVVPQPLVLVGNPPSGTVGTPYATLLTATGGVPPYTFSQISGTLPPGLALSAAGLIAGTPTTMGTYMFTAQVKDAVGTTAAAAFTVTIVPAGTPLTIASPPIATVGVPYTGTIPIAGGKGPYTCAIVGGTLPAGLSASSCVISGTPTTSGTVLLSVTATDSSNPAETATGPVTLTVLPAPILVLSNPPNATVNVPYTGNIGVSGGTAPYSCQIVAGTLPAGLTANNCTISGTTAVAGPVALTVKATDSSNPTATTTGPVTFTVNSVPATLTLSNPPNGTVNVAYSGMIGVAGGTSPYTCQIVAGTLPTGLTATNCTISGTTTVAGPVALIVKATDSSTPANTTTGQVTFTINPAATVLTLSNPPNATVSIPYTGLIGVSGGTAPYTCQITAGTLPTGLTANNCTISGTTTVAGPVNITVKATDSSGPTPVTTTGPVTFTVNPAAATLTLSNPPNGTVNVAYSGTIGVAGGTSPYTCQILAGTLPAGLTATNCTISGTTSVSGTVYLTVRGTDSSTPANTTTGPVTFTINPATATLTLSNPPNATVGIPYSGLIGVSGGTAPYTCQITAGTLPTGLTANNCTISGTTTVAGPVSLTVKGTDSSNPANTTTGPVTFSVSPAAATLTLSNPPNGTVNVAYSGTIGVAGGTSPYTCQIVAGTLPTGLTASNCAISGTTSVAGAVNLTVKATDSSNPANTTTGPVSFTINPAANMLSLSNPPNATVGVPYTGLIGVSGGTAPYTCQIIAGTLPTGLTANNCTISGTTTVAGPVNITVKATDSSPTPVTTTGPVTFTVNPGPAATLTLSNPPNGTVQTPYTGTIGVSGGTAPYNCTIPAGSLPPGLTNSSCVITGTPTMAGTTTLPVTATDSSTPMVTTTGTVTLTIVPLAPVTLTGSLPNATLGVPYTQTLTAQGGLPPYTYTLTAGTLPPGITLSKGGVISGTPTAVGASSFTVTATDSQSTPQSASLPLVLLVVYPTTPNDAQMKGPYAFLFQGYDDALAGVLASQTATAGSFVADGAGAIGSGELDTNHQSSTATGATIKTNNFLGTYTLGSDDRGKMTITTLNADGTTASTSTYAIAFKAPVSPATVATQGDLIEFDNNQLQGTKGSGTILAQTTSSFATGLTGSYAFGAMGDTPCLPSCTLNVSGLPVAITGGPVAAVGVFTASGGAITGQADSNVGATYTPSSVLTGSFAAADGNGRVQLSMTTSGTATGIFPTDYAVYLVSATQAFVVSTDKHSAYDLLAGSAQLQTQATFGNAAMTGAFVGYENSEPNPGLVGSTLQGVTNFSTATIFQGTDTGNGSCSINSVDTGGVTALVTQLTGLGGSATGLTNLLAAYDQTGTTTCPVAVNGRGTLQYPEPSLLGIPLFTAPAPRVFYLSSPNAGYFLETGYAGVGKLEAQTGAPFTLANTFTGTYVYGNAPASSAASVDSSGVIVSNGAGQATSTLDMNVGVGTINILQVGTTSTYPYTVPNAYGRFTLGPNGIVIYAITPSRFVLLDTNPLTTSPAVAVLF